MLPGMLGGLVNTHNREFRFLRLTIADTRTTYAGLRDLRYSKDGGATWLPSANMTSNSAPSPLVASANSEYSGSFAAFLAMDNSPTSSYWSTANGAQVNATHTIDLGVGNEIAPNALKFTNFNASGFDRSPTGLTLEGSQTGSFAGEQVVIYTVGSLPSNADLAVVTKIW